MNVNIVEFLVILNPQGMTMLTITTLKRILKEEGIKANKKAVAEYWQGIKEEIINKVEKVNSKKLLQYKYSFEDDRIFIECIGFKAQ